MRSFNAQYIKDMASSQAGLQALIHRVERPIMASYARTISHPPIFGALTRKVNPYGAVAILARKLAVTEPLPNTPGTVDLNDEIDFRLHRGKYREPDYVQPMMLNSWDLSPEDLWGSPEGANE